MEDPARIATIEGGWAQVGRQGNGRVLTSAVPDTSERFTPLALWTLVLFVFTTVVLRSTRQVVRRWKVSHGVSDRIRRVRQDASSVLDGPSADNGSRCDRTPTCERASRRSSASEAAQAEPRCAL